MAREYEGKVVFVGVSNNDTVRDGRRYVKRFNVPYAMAHAPDVWDLYEVPYQPVTIVLDEQGVVVARYEGPVTYEGLKQEIQSVVE